MPISNSSSNFKKSTLLAISLIGLVAGSSCATIALMDSGFEKTNRSTMTKHTLEEDRLIAFGTPSKALPNMPDNSVVIVGEKNSYVLSEGGPEMVNILTNLTPKNIQVDNNMEFYSPNNDGYFQGQMDLSYAKPKADINLGEQQFFKLNAGKECSKSIDKQNAIQRYCFSVPIKGAVYPAVSNLENIKFEYSELTKPYSVSIYTNIETTTTGKNPVGSAAKLVLLPFAVAFDVVTMPFIILGVAASEYN